MTERIFGNTEVSKMSDTDNSFSEVSGDITSEPEKADIAWLIYDLEEDEQRGKLQLVQSEIVYTEFAPALEKISRPEPGNIDDFIGVLQDKLDDKLENNPPDAPSLGDILLQ